MAFFVFIISLIGYYSFLCGFLRIKLLIAPFILISFSILVLYLFSLFQILNIGQNLFTGLGLILAAVMSFKTRNLRKYLTINNVFIVSVFLLPYIVLYHAIPNNFLFTGWDEFSFWAASVKTIFEANSLYTADTAISFKHYPPAQQLFQYLILKNTFWSEKNVLFAQGVFVLSALMTIAGSIKTQKTTVNLMLFYLSCALLFFFSFDLSHIYVDLLLAVCFAASFMLAAKRRTSIDDVGFYLSIFVLILLKEIGLILALVIFPVFIMSHFMHRDTQKTGAGRWLRLSLPVVLYFLVIILALVSWKLYVNKIGASSVISIPDWTYFLKDSGLQRTTATLTEFHKRIHDFQYLRTNHVMLGFSASMVYVVSMLSIFGFVLSYFQNRAHRTESIVSFSTMLAGFIGYVLFLLFCYLVIFSEYEGVILASFERYISTYILAWMLISCAYLFEYFDAKESRFSILFSASTMFVILYFVPNIFWKGLIEVNSPPVLLDARVNVNSLTEQVKKHLKSGERVYFVNQNSTGFETYMFNYTLLPYRSTAWCWSLGQKYYEGDIWTCNKRIDEIASYYDYLVIYNADKQFWADNGKFFDSPGKGFTRGVFKITRNNENVLSFLKVD